MNRLMNFNKLEIDKANPKIKYISVKEYFNEMGRIDDNYVKKAFEYFE